MYERRLKQLNPTLPNISYDVKDLNNFIDHMGELCALVYVVYHLVVAYLNCLTRYSAPQKAYLPHDKNWIKQKILNHLQKSVQ